MTNQHEFPVLGSTIEKDKPFESIALATPDGPQSGTPSIMALGRRSEGPRPGTIKGVINREAAKINKIGWLAFGSTAISAVLGWGYIFGNVAAASTFIVVATWAMPFVAAASIGWYLYNRSSLNKLKNR